MTSPTPQDFEDRSASPSLTIEPKEYYEAQGPRCPYCEHMHQPDEGFYYSEDFSTHDCHSCDRTFSVEYHRLDRWLSAPPKDAEASGHHVTTPDINKQSGER